VAEGISFQGPGEDEIKEQQRVDPELAWVVRWRETGEEPTEGELFIGDSRSKYSEKARGCTLPTW
jgi:hypothetical protein